MFKNYWNSIKPIVFSKASQNMVWLTASDLVKSLSGFLSFVILARALSQDEIGYIYALLGILMTSGQITDLGINMSLINLASKSKNSIEKTQVFLSSIQLKFLLSFFMVILGLILAPEISQNLFHNKEQTLNVNLMIIGSATQVLAGHFQSILQINSQFKLFSFIKAISNLAKLSFIMGLFFINKLNILFAVIAFNLVPFVSLVLNFIFSEKEYLKHFFKNSNRYKELISFSAWITLSQISNTLLSQVDIFMLSSMANPQEVARFAAGQRLPIFYPLIITAMVSVLMPKVSSMKSKDEVIFYIKKTLKVTPILALIFGLLPFFSEKPIVFLLGEKYQNAVIIFQIISIHYCLSFIFTPLSLVYYQMGKVKTLAYLNIFQLVVSCILNYFLIPIYYSEGAAITNLVIRLVAFVFFAIQLTNWGYLTFRIQRN